mgnify:CR=1 FL=1
MRIILEDEGMDGDNWVDLTLKDGDARMTISVFLDDLRAALEAFVAHRDFRAEHDERCGE